jgi:hypothetical protein
MCYNNFKTQLVIKVSETVFLYQTSLFQGLKSIFKVDICHYEYAGNKYFELFWLHISLSIACHPRGGGIDATEGRVCTLQIGLTVPQLAWHALEWNASKNYEIPIEKNSSQLHQIDNRGKDDSQVVL